MNFVDVTTSEGLLALKSGVVAAFFIAIFLAERVWAAARRPDSNRVIKNGLLWVLNALMSPLIILPISAFAAAHALNWRPEWMSGPAVLLFDLILLDLYLYFWHRLNHEVPLLWRFHEIHHLDEFLDSTSAIRFHFGEILLSAVARGLFVFLMGIDLFTVLVFETIVLIATLFHHSNIRLPNKIEAGLSRLIITPSIHWVHHHAVHADTDSNYGTTFSFWDRLFGTRSASPRQLDMRIGVEDKTDLPLTELLLRPFQMRR